MSKLAELIRRAIRAEPGPIGFASAAHKPPPTMLIVALVRERWARSVADAVAAGTDALLLTGRPNEKEQAEAVSAAEGRPCGLSSPDAVDVQPARVREAGLDFLTIEPAAPARALQDEELTYLLHLRDELTDIQLRTVESLPIQALYVERDTARPTIWHLMELQRVSGLARRPLLVAVQPEADQEDLLSLREAGVALASVDLKERDAIDTIRHLRSVIDALPRRRRPRREDRPDVTLPASVGSADAEEDEEDYADGRLGQ